MVNLSRKPKSRERHTSHQSSDHDLKKAWSVFLDNCSDEEMQSLLDSGVNPRDPLDDNLPMFHRLFEQTENSEGNSYFDKILGDLSRSTPQATEPTDPARDFAVAVAARVIAAFDCPQSPEVSLHSDCVKLALGIDSAGSQKDVSKRHSRSKQFVNWKVKSIQKRLGVGKSCFNRHFR